MNELFNLQNITCLPEINELHSEVDASKLTEFISCPRKFFFHYVLGWQSDTPSNHLSFGTAWHEAMELMLLEGYERTDEAFEAFLASYRQDFSAETDDDYSPKTAANARAGLKKYAKAYKRDSESMKTLHTEVAFRTQVGSGFTMCGRIDAIIENGRGLYPFDHKTGSRAGKTWERQFDLSMQTGLYTHAASCKYGFENILGTKYNGAFFYKSGETVRFLRVPAWRNAEQQRSWRATALTWLEQLRKEYELLASENASAKLMTAFPMAPTNCTNYGVCMYHDFCNMWANPLQHLDRVPIGFVKKFWSPFERPAKLEMEV